MYASRNWARKMGQEGSSDREGRNEQLVGPSRQARCVERCNQGTSILAAGVNVLAFVCGVVCRALHFQLHMITSILTAARLKCMVVWNIVAVSMFIWKCLLFPCVCMCVYGVCVCIGGGASGRSDGARRETLSD